MEQKDEKKLYCTTGAPVLTTGKAYLLLPQPQEGHESDNQPCFELIISSYSEFSTTPQQAWNRLVVFYA